METLNFKKFHKIRIDQNQNQNYYNYLFFNVLCDNKSCFNM